MMTQSRIARGVALLAGNGIIATEMYRGFRDSLPNIAALHTQTLAANLVICAIGLASAYQMVARAEGDHPDWAGHQSAAIVLVAISGLLSTPLGSMAISSLLP